MRDAGGRTDDVQMRGTRITEAVEASAARHGGVALTGRHQAARRRRAVPRTRSRAFAQSEAAVALRLRVQPARRSPPAGRSCHRSHHLDCGGGASPMRPRFDQHGPCTTPRRSERRRAPGRTRGSSASGKDDATIQATGLLACSSNAGRPWPVGQGDGVTDARIVVGDVELEPQDSQSVGLPLGVRLDRGRCPRRRGCRSSRKFSARRFGGFVADDARPC